jgi:pimeloyl-ACP methyl ester carboxylesterase
MTSRTLLPTWTVPTVLFTTVLTIAFCLAASFTAAVIIFIFGLSFLGTLLTSALFCYEESNRTKKPVAPLLRLCLRTAPRGVLSQAFALCLFPLGLRRKLWRRPTPGKDLVVMVHGLFHNPGAWILFRPRLHAAGHATACFSYSSWNTELEEILRELEEYLHNLVAQNPDRNIHLVGHSLGGLLLRACLGRMAMVPENVRSLTTWGTPFGGSKLSPFAFHSLGRYLEHDGETVRNLAALPYPAHVRTLALRSAVDGMVLPQTALHCPVPGRHEKECAPMSHVAMLYAESIFEETEGWIRQASNT